VFYAGHGIALGTGRINYVVGAGNIHSFRVNSVDIMDIGASGLTLPTFPAKASYANDAAAATGGVAVGQVYRNGSVLQVRVA
jgi:hypothetical protein